MVNHRHLQDILIRNREYTDRGITFIHEFEQEHFISYSQLYEDSVCLLHALREQGVKANQELLFQIEDNQAFIELFWACILGNFIPVPVTVGSNDETRLKIYKVWRKLNNPYLVGSEKVLEHLEKYASLHREYALDFDQMKRAWINPSNVIKDQAANYIEEPQPDSIAFIQFSSGSTGDPKGVMLSHKNVVSNVAALADRWSLKEGVGSVLSWIPLTHDMGLIAMHILCSYSCIDQYIMPAKQFIRNPILWMEKASQYRVGGLFCPNFGYKYFLSFYQKSRKYNWDLSSVQFICNGAEPISTELCERFMNELSIYGLKKVAMKAVYGLAEGTVGVSITPRNEEFKYVSLDFRSLHMGQEVKMVERGDPNSMLYADVGYPIESCEVVIVNEAGNELNDCTVGYIWIRGSSVSQGYYNDSNATERIIKQDGWLHTGDIGFKRKGRLVVIGREKDVLLVNGQNVFSHDIERIAEEVEGITHWNVAATGARRPNAESDDILLFLLYRSKDLDHFVELAKKVTSHIQQKMGIYINHVLPTRDIPKTTSGKLQRYKLAESYIQGDYDSLISTLEGIKQEKIKKSPIDIQEVLDRIFQDVLGRSLGMDEHFLDAGGNSLLLTKVTDELQSTYGIEVKVADLFNYPTINLLVEYIKQGDTIRLPSVGLPEIYFLPTERAKNKYTATLDKLTSTNLRALASAIDAETRDIMAAGFFFLLKEISQEQMVTILISNDNDHFIPVEVNFESLNSFDSLINQVKSNLSSNEANNDLSIEKDLKRIQTPEAHRILPFFSSQLLRSMNNRVIETFSIVLEMNAAHDQIELYWNFNRQYLNEHKMKEMFTQYIMLMSDIAGVSAKQMIKTL